MGQPVAVEEKPTTQPSMRRFELNRSLTGMEHERYEVGSEVIGDRPPDVLASRLLSTGSVKSVHVFSNQVNVELLDGKTGDDLLQLIEDLYIHYLPGVKPSYPPEG